MYIVCSFFRLHPLHDVLGPADADQLPPPGPRIPGHDTAPVALLHGLIAQHVSKFEIKAKKRFNFFNNAF